MTAQPTETAPAEKTEQPEISASGLIVSYKAPSGRRRLVLLAVDENGVWLVYDVPAGSTKAKTGVLVDRLLGDQEKVEEARALAVNYAACQTAFAQGHREEHPNPNPLPKPTRVPIQTIRQHAAWAAVTPAAERDLAAEAAWFEHVLTLANARSSATVTPEPQTVAA